MSTKQSGRVIGWVIDRDYFDAGGTMSRVGYGQVAEDVEAYEPILRRVTMSTNLKVRDVVDPVRFRLLDDDGEIYYGGAIRRDWIDGDEDFAFGPLVFAQADAGATELQYHYGDGNWKTL